MRQTSPKRSIWPAASCFVLRCSDKPRVIQFGLFHCSSLAQNKALQALDGWMRLRIAACSGPSSPKVSTHAGITRGSSGLPYLSKERTAKFWLLPWLPWSIYQGLDTCCEVWTAVSAVPQDQFPPWRQDEHASLALEAPMVYCRCVLNSWKSARPHTCDNVCVYTLLCKALCCISMYYYTV